MLWWLLYPLRGTTQPPRLSANHPIRRAFYRHGKTTAQHWLLAMLASVAIAMGFSYPTLFLAESPTAGFAAYPHHVWTSAKPYEGDPAAIDVEMRQVWVHGSYMQALDKDVLKQALEIQKVLVGGEKLTTIFPTLPEKLRESTLSWGFHSPLMYWNSSTDIIDRDQDILRTINDQSRTSSSLNVVLRPASVFAGKVFDRKHLKAADALVMTFMNKVGAGGVGEKWHDKMKLITSGACEDCTLFPSDGNVTRNKVYEFSFMPLSFSENVALTVAYTCMALYVLLSLRRLKAFHSRFGLAVTAITQMTCSVLASFTICGMLKINLSMIPQNAYPFVVLVIGLENMFRLINAILAYPATMATDQRIANALGDVGPVSLLTAGQNVFILAVLGSFVSPGVAAFCFFACIATLFDAFFLLTFFVAVLNVDIRRLELQDALARSNQQHRIKARKPSPSKYTWFDALVHGRLPFSTRMAGTAVTTTFILSLNYHFFEHHEKTSSLRHLLGLARGGPRSIAEFDTFTPPPMNATLTPGEWMRMQDFDTAREVMRLVKPGADSFIIRVFAPLIVVLGGADRTGASSGVEAWTHALRSYAVHHFYPVAVAIVFAVAFVAVLMNFLLYSEVGEELFGSSSSSNDRAAGEAVMVQSISLPHKLDVVKLSGSERGHFVTVALDRTIAISLFDRVQKNYTTLAVPDEVLCSLRWPVHNVAVDEAGEWAAFHATDDQVVIYSCATGRTIGKPFQYPDDNPPVLFQYVRLPSGDGMETYLLIVTSGGRMVMAATKSGEVINTSVSSTPLLGAAVVDFGSQGRKLFGVAENRNLVALTFSGSNWLESGSQQLFTDGRLSGAVEIKTYDELGPDMLVVSTQSATLFVDATTLAVVGNLDVHRSVRGALLMGPTVSCPSCGSLAFCALGLATGDTDTHNCSLDVLFGGEEGQAPLCLRASSSSCRSFAQAQRTTHEVRGAGTWAALNTHAVLGLKRKPKQANGDVVKGSLGPARTRHRRRASVKSQTAEECNEWEAYAFSIDGEVETAAVPSPPAGEHDIVLYVNNPGPTALLDFRSVAVAFGNTVKVIRSSMRGSKLGQSTGPTLERHSSTRRLTLRKGQ